MLALGNIPANTCQQNSPARTVTMNFSSSANVVNAAIRPDRAIFCLVDSSCFDSPVKGCLYGIPVFRMNNPEKLFSCSGEGLRISSQQVMNTITPGTLVLDDVPVKSGHSR